MQINYLSLVNFRNYAAAEFNFTEGFNLLLGKNGQGKTNAVESIIFLATQNSHRTNSQKALIKQNASDAIIRAKLLNRDREALIEVKIVEKGANKYFLNKRNVSAKEIQQILQAVIFAPEDLQIVRGEPSHRRSFIDQILVSRYPAAIIALQDYERAIRQKSSLLKSIRQGNSSGVSTLSLWNDQIIELGAQIIYYRHLTINDLNPLIEESYEKISGQKANPFMEMRGFIENVSRETSAPNTGIGFGVQNADVSRETIREVLREKLEANYDEELLRAQCLIGPHRDDINFSLNDLPVKGFASHGETWSFVLALKLGVARLLAAESNYGDPIIVLDDVFAELDRNRQQRLISEIKTFQQVIVTAAVPDDVPQDSISKKYKIVAGQVFDEEGLSGENLSEDGLDGEGLDD